MMLVLDALETERALPYPELIAEIKRCAVEKVNGTLVAPKRLSVPLAAHDWLLCMPAAGPDIFVTKIITVSPANPAIGLDAIQGVVVVGDVGTGARRMIMDGPTVTGRRTAALSLAGIELLLARKPASVALIGTGAQARFHALALIGELDPEVLFVVGTRHEKAVAFASEIVGQAGRTAIVPLTTSSWSAEAVRADVIIALTSAATPVIPEGVPSHTLVIGAGAFRPEMMELPAALLRDRCVVVDNLVGAREAGDLIQADLDWDQIREIGQIVASQSAARPVPVFKTVGSACWDLAAARVAARGRIVA